MYWIKVWNVYRIMLESYVIYWIDFKMNWIVNWYDVENESYLMWIKCVLSLLNFVLGRCLLIRVMG